MLNRVAAYSLCGSSSSLDTYKAFAQSWRGAGSAELQENIKSTVRQTSSVKCDVPQAQIRCTPSLEVSTSLVPLQKIAMGSAGKQRKCSWR